METKVVFDLIYNLFTDIRCCIILLVYQSENRFWYRLEKSPGCKGGGHPEVFITHRDKEVVHLLNFPGSFIVLVVAHHHVIDKERSRRKKATV